MIIYSTSEINNNINKINRKKRRKKQKNKTELNFFPRFEGVLFYACI